MSEEVKEQVISEMKASPTPMVFFKWMIQHMLLRVQLLVFVRYILSGNIKRGVAVL